MPTDVTPFIALTDRAWFDFLSTRAMNGYVDEVNFWSPTATAPIKKLPPGHPVFFRLKKPWNAIAGYAFFAHFAVLDLAMAWACFDWKNGDPEEERFLQRIGGYRGVDLLDPRSPRAKLGCNVLRRATFWPKERWIPWGEPMGWDANIVRGKTETDSARATRLLLEMAAEDQLIPDDLSADDFSPRSADERTVRLAAQVVREGQGAFRARVLDAYGRRCAVTGEHTEPVLDAAHIQPYLGPGSNHVQNGLLLTKEFHTLFDLGYVGITGDYTVKVSPALQRDWQNGRRYYPYDGQRLVSLPTQSKLRPSARALEWHLQHRFKSAS